MMAYKKIFVITMLLGVITSVLAQKHKYVDSLECNYSKIYYLEDTIDLPFGWGNDWGFSFMFEGNIHEAVGFLMKKSFVKIRGLGKIPTQKIRMEGSRINDENANLNTFLKKDSIFHKTDPLAQGTLDCLKEKYPFKTKIIYDSVDVWILRKMDSLKFEAIIDTITVLGGCGPCSKDTFGIEGSYIQCLTITAEGTYHKMVKSEISDERYITIKPFLFKKFEDFTVLNQEIEQYGVQFIKEKRLEEFLIVEFLGKRKKRSRKKK
jgi:hypothetical protein